MTSASLSSSQCALFLAALFALTALGGPAPAGAPRSAPPPLVERGIRMQERDPPFYERLAAEGTITFEADGRRLGRAEALRAVGAAELARRQALSGLVEELLPVSLGFPVLAGSLLGLVAGATPPSILGASFVEVVQIGWVGAVIGGALGLVAAGALLAFGLAAIRWIRPGDRTVIRAVRAHNRRVADEHGLTLGEVGSGWLSPAERTAE